MRLFNGLLVLLCLVWGSSASAAPEGGWLPAKDADGVRVFLRRQGDSPFLAFKGVTRVDADLKTILALFHNTDSHPRWMAGTISATGKDVGESGRVVHNRSAYPWPVAKRDVIIRSKAHVEPDSGALIIDFLSAPDLLPHEADYVRIEKLQGLWQLRPLDGNRTEVTYQIHLDPGGWVPAWLFNRIIADIPLDTLQNLARELSPQI